MIFNFGYLGTNTMLTADSDRNCYKHPIPGDAPSSFGHRKILLGQGNGPSDHFGGGGNF
jgi:hypothetical protein